MSAAGAYFGATVAGSASGVEVAAADVLHGDVVIAIADPDVVDPDDMGVIELRNGLAFLDEPLGKSAVGGERGRHHLQRDGTLQ